MRRRLAAVPPWAWLAALVVVSTAVRYAFARRNVAPWIMIDEIIYSELAKSVAGGHGFDVREVPVSGYGFVYPILVAPAYALFDAVPTAYAALKAINSLAMSLAAVPAYLLARRVASVRGALVVALLTVLVPSTFYAANVMTENAFYPLFLLAALALVAMLERPAPLRVALFLGALGLAFATRAQAVALLPAALTAPLLVDPRRLGRYRWLYGAVAGLALVFLAFEAARGRGPSAILGAYSSTTGGSYDPVVVAKWLLWHLGDLDFYVGFVPVVALAVLLAELPRLSLAERAAVASAVSVTAWFAVEVAAFATQPSVLRLEERNLFYVAPLLFVVLILWVERGLPRPRVATAVGAGAAVVLAAAVPFGDFVRDSSIADTLMTLPLWSVSNWFAVPLGDLRWLVALLAAVFVAVAAFVPRRAALVVPALVAALYLAVMQPVEARTQRASIGALFQGITNPDRDWIDAAVGRDARVGVLWSGLNDRLVVNENEFFNRSVRDVFHLRDPVPGNLAETGLAVDERTGLLRDPAGRPVRVPYLLADASLPLSGRPVARDRTKGMELLRVNEPLHVRYVTPGVGGDGWAGAAFTVRRIDCRGPLVARLGSDPGLFRRAQVVRAYVGGGRLAATVRVPPNGERTVRVPGCVVRFRVARTAIPAKVQPGSTDTRRLGVRLISVR